MTAGSAASRRVLARTPVAPLPASSPTRPVGITGRTSAPPDSSLPYVCSFQLPKVCSFRLPLTIDPSGSIPARAGETRLSCRCLSASRVHPRACGGNRDLLPELGADEGPSPRVRGKPDWIRLFEVLKRSIPARAGETSSPRTHVVLFRVHPRACGGNGLMPLTDTQQAGPSPLLRGCQ